MAQSTQLMYPLKMVDLSIVTLVYQRVFPFPGEFTNIYPINDPVMQVNIPAPWSTWVYVHIFPYNFPWVFSMLRMKSPLCCADLSPAPPHRLRSGARRDDDDLRRGVVAVASVVLGASNVGENPWEIHGKTMENQGKPWENHGLSCYLQGFNHPFGGMVGETHQLIGVFSCYFNRRSTSFNQFQPSFCKIAAIHSGWVKSPCTPVASKQLELMDVHHPKNGVGSDPQSAMQSCNFQGARTN